MLHAAISVRSLLVAILLMMTGAGYLATLITLRLQDSGAGALMIALVTTAYFGGLTIGSLRAPRIINRVGHIRAFSAFVSLFSATALIYTLVDEPVFWVLLRFIDGLSVAAVFICLESWLNERAEDRTRGTVLSAYMIALYLGQAAGQQLLNLSPGAPALPFLIASIPISLAVIPIALTRLTGPTVQEHLPISLRRLYHVSPLGSVGAVASGVMLGSFYGLGAAYGRRLGMSVSDTAAFMSVVIVGGVALQWPLGLLSDRFDRRRVIVATAAGCVVATLLLGFFTEHAIVYPIGALFGGLSFALYPLSVAHTNDHLDAAGRLSASGGLILIYSVGAACGPLVAGVAMEAVGPGGLFLWLAVCSLGVLGFALWRQITSEPVPADQQQSYQILPRTTPATAKLDVAAAAEQLDEAGSDPA
ncbi:MFS family permease [Altererythrobacter atlanticus]|uniref:MFS-type transporter YcaD n=1 Tax=Croceibacterium atlanticum TaxID=1267766 RepID=A0A0F7KQQ4_9SPHN|nr:MFS transporter [Croceibacterium atlanticum]AKH41502.1 putative MFS-type transporter YcaD [Croceibacterium atlanticum]MBB5732964.1 MFS family permease [Croceibacterium atlanticum]